MYDITSCDYHEQCIGNSNLKELISSPGAFLNVPKTF